MSTRIFLAQRVALVATLLGLPVAAIPPGTAAVAAETKTTAAASVTYASGMNSTRVGDITVHYNAIPSTTLTPDIARRNGLTRSSNRALLNVSVQRGERAADGVAIPARIEAAATNPVGQRQTLNLREVQDGSALYYLGEARIEERDTIDFDLVVTVDDSPPIRVRYRQEFWPAATTR